ncbi:MULTISPECIES: L-serine ammonia-lyase [Pseudovibrio]|uniref:L-serine ammonia-lyase n=1 Tax=Stappiaceae TaxID=2821832 RepID=UPI0023650265|nr:MULTISPECIES: L-serine ammonia-lyase [Pseudovibrio]MDD7911584.1 L-serine ammonia-lyase [Pseudovibrio exalbescens]MDX5594319.1 L-serine ammonia-lyase [Pseudovibrio sp. SPO723]
MFSTLDIFKVGVGPSSSHTIGPMKAAKQFVDTLRATNKLREVTRITVDIYGSLSLTGKGHQTDIAIIMGLAGNSPESVDISTIPAFIKQVEETGQLPAGMNSHMVAFPTDAITFHEPALALHENGMKLHAFAEDELVLTKTYYSIGGGFIVDEENFGRAACEEREVPHPFADAEELLNQCKQSGMSISALILENEKAFRTEEEINEHLNYVWSVMSGAIDNGMKTEGILAGPLRVPRRAAALHRQLTASARSNTDPMAVVDWINLFALAVSEENAAGGRVVTAPTNGAAGILPAVLAYFDKFVEPISAEHYTQYFLAAGAIGALYRMNASISGAEVGCQGEVGVACSMAAAGLAELMGASPAQVCIAAEIGMEHNLGLTCDPVAGQVQVPCIERNAIAAVKAVNSARMALRRNSDPVVSLDKVIATMYQTGKDMCPKYRETSQGGLAVKVLQNAS